MNLVASKHTLAALLLLCALSTIVPVHAHGDHSPGHHRHGRKLIEKDNIFSHDEEEGHGEDHDSDEGHGGKDDGHADELGEELGDVDGTDGMKGDGGDADFACGIVDPTVEEIARLNELVTEYKEGSRGDFMMNTTVPICFHVITSSSGVGDLTDAQLQLQVDALNVAFSGTSCCDPSNYWCSPANCSSESGFRFEMLANCTTRTANDVWYTADTDTTADTAMKQTLRVGGPDVLNIYFQDLPGGLLGSSWFPWWIDDRLWRDGINQDNTAIVGGSSSNYREGDVLAHEVGHWLGLYHTFQWGCSPNEGIVDTSPESYSASGCPIGRDTCAGGGDDPIHNFMDYTYDYCKFEFTPDQIAVMHVSHAVFRAERVSRDMLTLENSVLSDPLTLAEEEFQLYNYTLGGTGPVTCVASYFDELTGRLCTSDCMNGNANLYLRWEAPPGRYGPYDCASQDSGSYESCTSTPSPGDTTLYVGVYAQVTFLDLITICYEDDPAVIIPLTNNTASSAISLASGDSQVFRFPLVSRTANVTCFSTCDNGNADMFVGLDYLSHLSGLYDCASNQTGSVEECTIADVASREVFVSIEATSAFTGLTLTCYEIEVGTIVLANGVPSGLLSLSTGDEQYYRYPVEFLDKPGSVTCLVAGPNGDANLMVSWSEYPVRGESPDCGSYSGNSYEGCTLNTPLGASDLYILVYASYTFSNVRVTCFEDPGSSVPSAEPTSTVQPSLSPSVSNAPSSASDRSIMYGVSRYGYLYLIDHYSGSTTFIGYTREASSGITVRLRCLAFDRSTNTMYGHTSSFDSNFRDYLVVLDLETAEVTLIGQANFSPMIALAFDAGGQLYGWNEYYTDDLYVIDKHTGNDTLVGESGYYLEEVGMAFDHTGVLHLLNDNGDYYLLDPNTGNATYQGEISGKTIRSSHGDILSTTRLFYQVEYTSGGTIEIVDLATQSAVGNISTGVSSLYALAFASQEPSTLFVPSSLPSSRPSSSIPPTMVPSLSTVPSSSSAPSGYRDRFPVYGITNDPTSSSLYVLDLSDGSSQLVGVVTEKDFGIPLRLRCLAFDFLTNTLYGHTSSIDYNYYNYLVVVDVLTAEATIIGRSTYSPLIALAFDSAGQLYGWNEYGADDLYLINKHTGADTLVGLSGYYTEEVGMAFDSNGTLHLLNDNGYYYLVDPNTGVATFQSDIAGIRASHGDIFPDSKDFYQVEYTSGGRIVVVDLDAQTQTGTISTGISTLYALSFGTNFPSTFNDTSSQPSALPSSTNEPTLSPSYSSAPSRESDRRVIYGITNDYSSTSSSLYLIDPSTGSTTLVGVVIEAGTPRPLRLRALAYDSTSDVLYGHTSTFDARRRNYLVIVDVLTAEATLVGQASYSPMIALAFDSAGQLFGWNEYGSDDLYLIDKYTGADTLVGFSGYLTEEVGMAFDSDGTLHLLNDDGEYYLVDPSTGVATFQRDIPGIRASHGDIFPGTKDFYQVQYSSGGRIVIVDLDAQAQVRTINTGLYTLFALAVGPEIGTLPPSRSPSPSSSMIPSIEPTITPRPTTARREILLRNGVPSPPLTLGYYGQQYYIYPLDYPDLPGSVTCTIAGDNGDADLMVQWSSFPVREGTFDCLPYISGSNEVCTLDVPPDASNLYILVYGFSSFSDVVVTCTETPGTIYPLSDAPSGLPSSLSASPTIAPTNFVSEEPSLVPSVSAMPSRLVDQATTFVFTLPYDSALPSTLFRLDHRNGTETRIGDIAVAGTEAPLRIGAMAFDSDSETLYAHTSHVDDTYPDFLVTLDMLTAEATLIGQASHSPVMALAFDASGQLYAWNEFDADDLYMVDKDTGADTLVGHSMGVFTGEVGLAFDYDGILHLLDDDENYYVVNPSTGLATSQGGISGRTLSRASRGDILPDSKLFYQVEYPRGSRIEVVDLQSKSAIRTIDTSISDLYGLAFTFSKPTEIPSSSPSALPSSAPSAISDRAVFFGVTLDPSSSSLYKVDAVSGNSTLVGVITLAGVGTPLRLRDVAIDATNGTLYGHTSSFDTNYPDYLVTVNMSSAAATLVGATRSSPMSALAFSGGVLYAWSLYGAHDLHLIDKATGMESWVGPSGFSTGEVGMAFDATGVLHVVSNGDTYYTVDAVWGVGSPQGAITGVDVTSASHGDLFPDTLLFYQPGNGATVDVVDLGSRSVVRTVDTGISSLYALAFAP